MREVLMNKTFKQVMHMFRILKHPIDGFEEIKFNNMGSIGSANIILLMFAVFRTIELGITNFIFNKEGLENKSALNILVQTVIPFFIWITSNYLVSTISKGQGRVRDVYIGTAYVLSPYIIFSIPLAALSNIFTAQEQAIYLFFRYGIILWCVLLLFIEIMIVHGYEIGETVANILWSLFTVAMMVVIAFATWGIVMQNYNYIYSIIMEVLDIV